MLHEIRDLGDRQLTSSPTERLNVASAAVARVCTGFETGPSWARVVGKLHPVLRRKIVDRASECLRAGRPGRERATADALGERVPVAKRVRDPGAARTGVDGDVIASRAGRLRIPPLRGLPRFGTVGDWLKRIRVPGACQLGRSHEARRSGDNESYFHS
jgi:hypothetical protein